MKNFVFVLKHKFTIYCAKFYAEYTVLKIKFLCAYCNRYIFFV